MKKFSLPNTIKAISALLIVTFLCIFPGCMFFYKIQKVNKVTPQEIKKFDSLNKYLILHQGKSAWHLSPIEVNDHGLSGTLSVLPYDRMQYMSNYPDKGNRYKYEDGPDILDQVHFYLKDSLITEYKAGDKIKIDTSAISRSEIYKKAVGRTLASWLIPAIGGTVVGAATVVVVVAIIAILTKSSCPLVYIRQNDAYAFAGEIFGGAVYSSLERHDYLPLPGFQPSDGLYTLKIANKLPEIQFVNLAELWIVNHPEQLEVLPDRHGYMHTINHAEPPMEAFSSSKADVLFMVTKKDQNSFLFDEEPGLTGDTCAFNTVFLTFPAPGQPDTGKLIIRAGNSLWGDYTYGEFGKLFGNKFGKWMRTQDKKPAEKSIQWKMDQRFVLMIYLETEKGWQFVDFFDLIGPLGARDMIMPVNLSGALFTKTPDNGKTVRIKIESGFKFWELDYAAMDFSRDTTFTMECIQPSSAITETGKNVTQLLSTNDTKYYIQEKMGEEGVIEYRDSPVTNNMKKSVFLHGKGYYTPVRDYPGPPDKQKLLTFQIPGRFSKFSYDNYTEFRKNKRVFASYPKVP